VPAKLTLGRVGFPSLPQTVCQVIDFRFANGGSATNIKEARLRPTQQPKRLARLMALSRSTRSIVGGSSLSIPASLSVMAATTQAMSQEFGTKSKAFKAFHSFIQLREANGDHIGTAVPTCPKSSPSPAFAGSADGRGRLSRHSVALLGFAYRHISVKFTLKTTKQAKLTLPCEGKNDHFSEAPRGGMCPFRFVETFFECVRQRR
jgi:hypothetical protein